MTKCVADSTGRFIEPRAFITKVMKIISRKPIFVFEFESAEGKKGKHEINVTFIQPLSIHRINKTHENLTKQFGTRFLTFNQSNGSNVHQNSTRVI